MGYMETAGGRSDAALRDEKLQIRLARVLEARGSVRVGVHRHCCEDDDERGPPGGRWCSSEGHRCEIGTEERPQAHRPR